MCGYLDDPRLFFVLWLFVESLCLFCSVKLSTCSSKILHSCGIFSFPAYLHIWTLSSSDCMILRSIFWHWGQLRDSNTTINKRFKCSLMLLKKIRCIKSQGLNIFEFEDQGTKHASIFCCCRRPVLNGEKHFYILCIMFPYINVFGSVQLPWNKKKCGSNWPANIKIIRKVFVCTSKHISVSWLCMHIHGPKWEQVTEF